MTAIRVSVQEADFDVARLQTALLAGVHEEGAVASFTGYVRRANDQRTVYTLELEHYPGMTEGSIRHIIEQSAERWPLLAAAVVHRVGKLSPGDQIVWVGVASTHREAAFSACEFIMDYLKTRAPFWKKERGPKGEYWVSARQHDNSRAARWQEDSTL
jgi:molybdopterin synthase catalytic subunit